MCRTAPCTIAPTRPATNPSAPAPPSSSARRSAGKTRMTCSMPARSTSPSARAGIRSTRWRATPSPSISKARRCTPCPIAARPSRKAPLDAAETEALVEVILRQPEPAYLPHLTALLTAGKSPRAILDAIQVGAATVGIETHNDLNFSLPQHCYEYCNTLGWFWDKFDHPQRIKLLYLAAAYLNQNAWHQKLTGDLTPPRIEKPANTGALGADEMAAKVEAAC